MLMSFTIILQQRSFRFPALLPHFFSNSSYYSSHNSVGVESYYASLLEESADKIHLNQIHNQLYTHGLQNNGYIITKFILVCCNLKEIDYARQLFDGFHKPYVFLWNAIISGYSVNNMLDKAIDMYSRMLQKFVNPDSYTFPHVLKACGVLVAKEIGCAVHGQILRHGFDDDVFLQNGLLAFYVKCGKNNHARVVFDGLNKRNVVSWTSLMSGYAQNGQPMEALRIFRDMRGSGVKPDWIALVNVLRAYSDLEELEQGSCVHGLVIKMGLEFGLELRIALTSIYAKCGQVMVAKALFDQLKIHNAILWNAMISGFAKNGNADEALVLFLDMISRKFEPDAVTIQSAV